MRTLKQHPLWGAARQQVGLMKPSEQTTVEQHISTCEGVIDAAAAEEKTIATKLSALSATIAASPKS